MLIKKVVYQKKMSDLLPNSGNQAAPSSKGRKAKESKGNSDVKYFSLEFYCINKNFQNKTDYGWCPNCPAYHDVSLLRSLQKSLVEALACKFDNLPLINDLILCHERDHGLHPCGVRALIFFEKDSFLRTRMKQLEFSEWACTLMVLGKAFSRCGYIQKIMSEISESGDTTGDEPFSSILHYKKAPYSQELQETETELRNELTKVIQSTDDVDMANYILNIALKEGSFDLVAKIPQIVKARECYQQLKMTKSGNESFPGFCFPRHLLVRATQYKNELFEFYTDMTVEDRKNMQVSELSEYYLKEHNLYQYAILMQWFIKYLLHKDLFHRFKTLMIFSPVRALAKTMTIKSFIHFDSRYWIYCRNTFLKSMFAKDAAELLVLDDMDYQKDFNKETWKMMWTGEGEGAGVRSCHQNFMYNKKLPCVTITNELKFFRFFLQSEHFHQEAYFMQPLEYLGPEGTQREFTESSAWIDKSCFAGLDHMDNAKTKRENQIKYGDEEGKERLLKEADQCVLRAQEDRFRMWRKEKITNEVFVRANVLNFTLMTKIFSYLDFWAKDATLPVNAKLQEYLTFKEQKEDGRDRREVQEEEAEEEAKRGGGEEEEAKRGGGEEEEAKRGGGEEEEAKRGGEEEEAKRVLGSTNDMSKARKGKNMLTDITNTMVNRSSRNCLEEKGSKNRREDVEGSAMSQEQVVQEIQFCKLGSDEQKEKDSERTKPVFFDMDLLLRDNWFQMTWKENSIAPKGEIKTFPIFTFKRSFEPDEDNLNDPEIREPNKEKKRKVF